MSLSFLGNFEITSEMNGIKASVFSVILAKILLEKGTNDSLSSILLEVTQKVVLECDFRSSERNAAKPIPKTESTLIRHVYFKQKTSSCS